MKEMQRRIDSASPNRTGAVSKSYQEGWDRIFGKQKSCLDGFFEECKKHGIDPYDDEISEK
jgi:hypothetical protein